MEGHSHDARGDPVSRLGLEGHFQNARGDPVSRLGLVPPALPVDFPILGCTSARVEKFGCPGPNRCRPKRAPQKTRRGAARASRIELMALECVAVVDGSIPERSRLRK